MLEKYRSIVSLFQGDQLSAKQALTLVQENGLLHLSITLMCNFDSYYRYDDRKDEFSYSLNFH